MNSMALAGAEQRLLERIRARDMAALAEVYVTFSPALHRYAMRLLGDETMAEDCVTETFSRLLAALKMGNGPEFCLKAYLFRCAHNWITDYYRSTGHAISLDMLDDQSRIVDEAELPLQRVTSRQDAACVRKALSQLTSDQRQVILLRYYEGLSNDEVAAMMEKPVGAIKALLHRGLSAMRCVLAEQDDPNHLEY